MSQFDEAYINKFQKFEFYEKMQEEFSKNPSYFFQVLSKVKLRPYIYKKEYGIGWEIRVIKDGRIRIQLDAIPGDWYSELSQQKDSILKNVGIDLSFKESKICFYVKREEIISKLDDMCSIIVNIHMRERGGK